MKMGTSSLIHLNALPVGQTEVSKVKPSSLAESTSTERVRKDTSSFAYTIFTIPKPFTGSADRIQTNAISSWLRLNPKPEVFLFGDEPGVAEKAAELGVKHVSGLRRNSLGTPILSDAFLQIHQFSSAPVLVYCNSDVICFDDFSRGIQRLGESDLESFVGFGRRIDLSVDSVIDFQSSEAVATLKQDLISKGTPSSVVCKEYFVFRRGTYEQIPDFAVGRGNWDNWMIHSAKDRSIPVVDLSSVVKVLHQTHDYTHVGRSRWKCYVAGIEARENQRLAGGRHIIRGSTPTWTMQAAGLKKMRFSNLNLAFWEDSYRLLKLLKSLWWGDRSGESQNRVAE